MYDDEEHEQNVYGDNAREEQVRDDEISPEEAAFVQGFEEEEEETEDEDDSDYEAAFE